MHQQTVNQLGVQVARRDTLISTVYGVYCNNSFVVDAFAIIEYDYVFVAITCKLSTCVENCGNICVVLGIVVDRDLRSVCKVEVRRDRLYPELP